jgi:hypothetical protein
VAVGRQLATERAAALEETARLLNKLRLRGVGEEAVRQFVAKYSGDHWEEFYEATFGYDLMIEARRRLAATEVGRRRFRHATWRDPIVRWLDAPGASHQERTRQGGSGAATTRPAGGYRGAASAPPTRAPGGTGPDQPLAPGQSAAAAWEGIGQTPGPQRRQLWKTLWSAATGPFACLLLATLLFAGCTLWIMQNQSLQTALDSGRHSAAAPGTVAAAREAISAGMQPLHLPGLPEPVARVFVSFNPAFAASLLLVAAVRRSPRFTLFVYATAGVMLFGPQLVPLGRVAALTRLTPNAICLGLGLAALPGYVLVERARVRLF